MRAVGDYKKSKQSDGLAFFSALELHVLEKPVSRFALRAPRFRCLIPSRWTPCREQVACRNHLAVRPVDAY
jgi:hypothetical protein